MTNAQSPTTPVNADPQSPEELIRYYESVRSFTERMCEPMVNEDYVIQSMPDVSPTKWHLAHVTWFFETFVLGNNYPNYEPLNKQYNYLFNSYYNAVGESILTEYSHKYTIDSFSTMALTAGLTARYVWSDPNEMFAIFYLEGV